tara:strand:+ start:8847 stop:8972 length:126 start_codon:yes stop_codon:yes gene_type:complete
LEKDKIVQFPKLSEIDKQYLALEEQQKLIREQLRLIVEQKK